MSFVLVSLLNRCDTPKYPASNRQILTGGLQYGLHRFVRAGASASRFCFTWPPGPGLVYDKP